MAAEELLILILICVFSSLLWDTKWPLCFPDKLKAEFLELNDLDYGSASLGIFWGKKELV